MPRRIVDELLPHDVSEGEAGLLDYVVGIVEDGRRVAAVRMNAALAMTY